MFKMECFLQCPLFRISTFHLLIFTVFRRFEISKKGEVMKLLVKNLTEGDAGEYTCQVGERTTKCQVQVEECKYKRVLVKST